MANKQGIPYSRVEQPPARKDCLNFYRHKSGFFILVATITASFGLATLVHAYTPTSPTVTSPTVFTGDKTAKVDGASGALTQSIPIDLLPGRNSLQPNLSLDYNSQNTDLDNEVGYGWDLSIPYIERLNKTGSQNLYGPNVYFTSSLDGELASSGSTTISTMGTSTLPAGLTAYWKLDGNSNDATSTNNGTDSNITYGTSYGFINQGANFNGSSSQINLGNPSALNFTSAFTISAWVYPTATSSGPYGIFSKHQSAPPYGGVALVYANTGSAFTGFVNNTYTVNTANNYPPNQWYHVVFTYDGSATGTLYINGVQDGSANIGSISSNSANAYIGVGQANPTFLWHGNIDEVGIWNRVLTSTEISQLYNAGAGDPYPLNTFVNVFPGLTSAYYPRIDNGSFDQYIYATSTNSWTMYDKNGMQYQFGSTTQSQQSATTSPNNIYKWMLEKEVDPNGNYIRYVYHKDGNQIYPYQILYTGNGSTDGPTTVTFATSTRTDPTTSYKTGFQVNTNYRISQITVAMNGTTTAQYNLSYTTGNNGYRSLLSSVQENAWNDKGSELSEPATTFGYISSTTSFVSQNGAYSPAYVIADADGDGRNDITDFFYDSGGGDYNGEVNEDGSGNPATPPVYGIWGYGPNGPYLPVAEPNEAGYRFIDVNGDGKADIVKGIWNYTTSTATDALYINSSSGENSFSWYASTTYNGVIPGFWETGSGSLNVTTGIFGDVNGDGLPDYVEDVYSNSTGEGAYFGNGSTWNTATTSIFQPVEPMPALGSANYDSRLVDINGDGLDDWEWTDGTNTYFNLNNGNGWNTTPDPRWTISTSTIYYAGGGTYYDRGIRFIDVNGDGLPDYVHSYSVTIPNGGPSYPPQQQTYSTVMLNTGSGWATSTVYTFSYHVVQSLYGSGLYQGLENYELGNFLGNGQQGQDVLSTITYPKGGSTSATYGYTTLSGTNSSLPYNLLTVTKLVNHNGLGSNEETDYSYSGGLQYMTPNVIDRKFAGFSSVTETTPQAITVTYYSQGSTTPSMGDQSDGYPQLNHPYRKDVFTPSDTLVQKIFYQYNAFWHGLSAFVGLTRQLEQDYAADGSHQDKDTDYVYSPFNDNLTQIDDYGAVTGNNDGTFTDIPGDSRTTNISYATSTSITNLNLPTEKTVLNNSGATTTDTKYFYDSLPFGQIGSGNQTQEQDLTASSTYASSTKTYNSYGLVTQSKDRNGNITTYSYDTYNLYPATTTNALSQSTQYTYDYENGKVEKTINPNGGITLNTYDGLGRLIEADQSTPSNPSLLATSTLYQYTDNSAPPSVVHQTTYLSTATSTNTYDYYDGLNRLIQDRKSTENSGIYDVTDYVYNTAGALGAQTLPYFSSGSGNTIATSTQALYTYFTYDPLNRTLTTANAVGTTTNVYWKWITTTTDPNNNIKDTVLDAYNNLSQVVEHNATSNATTTYTYDPVGDVTNLTDASGNVRNFTYDGLGDMLSAQDLHIATSSTYGTWQYSYDPDGNVISQTDPKGQTITDTYDALGRLLSESLTGSGTQITKTYDTCTNGVGQICTASSTGAQDTYTYDVLGRVTNATTTLVGKNYALAYTYDNQGNITGVTNSADGSQINYTYNTAGLTSGVSRTSGGTNTPVVSLFTYAPTQQLNLAEFASGATTTYTYDPSHLYRLTQLTTYSPNSTSTSYTTQANISNGLISYWKLDGNSTDTAGSNNGTDSNMTYGSSYGKINQGANFNGSSSSINLGNTSSLNITGAFTIGAWVYPTATSSGPYGIFSKHQAYPPYGGIGLFYANSSTTFQGQVNNSSPDVTSSNYSPNHWYYVAFEYDGSNTGTLYVNGVQDGTASVGSLSSNTASAYIGVGQANPTFYWQGNIDEVGLWSRQLSSAEITDLYNSGNGLAYPLNSISTTTYAGDTPLQYLNYGYDADGNITSKIDNSNLYAPFQGINYTYDNRNRLTLASTTAGNMSPYAQTYSYDPLGNLLTGPDGTYTYGGINNANPDAVTQTQLITNASSPTIAFDNTTLGGNGVAASSLTFSHTTNSNTNGLIIVSVQEAAPTGSCTSDKVTGVTYNGTSLSDLGYYVGNTSPVNGALKTYYGYAPAQGTHNVVVSASASCILYAVSATYTGVKQSGMPDASGTGNPLNDSGSVTTFQATTTTSHINSWAVLVGVPSGNATTTAGSNTTLRQHQLGNIYYGDSNAPVSTPSAIGLNWSTTSALHWLANYFSIQPTVSNPGSTVTTAYVYDKNGNLVQTNNGTTTATYVYDYRNRLTALGINGATTTYAYDPFGSRISQTSGSSTILYPSKYYSIVSSTSGTTTTATSTDYIWSGNTLISTIDQKMLSGITGEGNVGGSGWTGSGHGGAGGGGGAGGVGSNGTSGSYPSGAGGVGLSSSISGSAVYYAGGGGGGGSGGGAGGNGGGGAGGNAGVGTAGTANTGGGGGGGGNGGYGGAAGGSGIVIISAPTGQISSATGGTKTTLGGNDIWTFTASGTWTPTITGTTTAVSYLVVGGGGGGGNDLAGGGGAGAFVTGSGYVVTSGIGYTVTVGAGGAAATNGSNSVFGTIVATGGGYGGNLQTPGGSGGSGGGGGGAYSAPGQVGGISSALIGSPIVRYVHGDNLGSTNVTSDSNGNLAQTIDYYPFGAVQANQGSGTTTSLRLFTGQFNDASGLVYDNARYYNSSQGQFMSEDPVFLGNPNMQNITDPQSLNAYSYSDDNPITREDPTGLFNILTGQIQKGDTLGAITSQINKTEGTNYTVSSLAAANGISHPNLIYTGNYINYSPLSTARVSSGANSSGIGSGSSGISGIGTAIGGIGNSSNFSFPSLQSHFNSHGADFGAESSEEYAQMAQDFLKKSLSNPDNSTLFKSDQEGNALRIYESETNTFGSYNTQSYGAWTFYKPNPDIHGFDSNMEYFESMDGESVTAEEATGLLQNAIGDIPL